MRNEAIQPNPCSTACQNPLRSFQQLDRAGSLDEGEEEAQKERVGGMDLSSPKGAKGKEGERLKGGERRPKTDDSVSRGWGTREAVWVAT